MDLPNDAQDFDFRILQIVLVQKMINPGPFCWDSYRVRRSVWGIACVPNGSYSLNYSDGTHSVLSTGDVALIPPSAAYRFVVNTPVEHPYLHYTINFEAASLPADALVGSHALVIHPADFSVFENLFRECHNCWSEKRPGYRMQVMGRVYQIVGSILQTHLMNGIPVLSLKQVESAQRHILEHFTEAISLEQLAGICSLSTTHFRRLFRTVYHTTPNGYLLNLRLEHAKYLLHSPTANVSEIAAQVGFQDTNYFIRFFKSRTGMTPLQYKKSL